MQFNEIRKELEGVVFDNLRIDDHNYFEAVVVTNELAKLMASLRRLFGSPVWPSKNRLLIQAQEITKAFGGIRPGQTLYSWSQGKDAVFTMLWPWKDGHRTTVKIIGK